MREKLNQGKSFAGERAHNYKIYVLGLLVFVFFKLKFVQYREKLLYIHREDKWNNVRKIFLLNGTSQVLKTKFASRKHKFQKTRLFTLVKLIFCEQIISGFLL